MLASFRPIRLNSRQTEIALSSDQPIVSSEGERLPYSLTDADGDHVLATHCPGCGFFNFPPSHVCAQCMSLGVQAKTLSRQGTVYSHTTMQRRGKTLFVGYVDLPEKIRVLGILEGFTQGPVCGDRVVLARARPLAEPNPEREPAFIFRPLTKG